MALELVDLDEERERARDALRAELDSRIDSLRTGFAGHQSEMLQRSRAYLRVFSPPFEPKIGEHDQWSDPFVPSTEDHFRSSYNLARAVVELWTALEMSDFPTIRWEETYIPVPPPALDEMENEARQQVFRSQKLVARSVSTMREQEIMRHVRRTKLLRHAYRAVRRKNIYGHAWLKTWPDRARRTFRIESRIDPSTVYPLWSAFDSDRLDGILVATRRSAAAVNMQYPGMFEINGDGYVTDGMSGYYTPTQEVVTDKDRAFVWVEDFWMLDARWEGQPGDDGEDAEPIRSRAINAIRINGRIHTIAQYPGWTRLPYVQWINENDRDDMGFSDVGMVSPFQDSINRFMSQQQDVIAGESRPKFKYRGDADRVITLSDEGVVSLDQDEDIEQIQVRLDVFPTQVHGQQILDMLSRVTGLPDTVWGRITAAQNSGKALATAWRAVAARLVPRTHGNATALESLLGDLWVGWMELYDWDGARDLYNGNREFDLKFPNQEPRDFAEVTLNAINRLQAGLIDEAQAMVETGEESPDEMLDRVRASYMDMVMHPEKGQAQLLLQQLKNSIAIQAQQAGLEMAAAQMQLQQQMAQPPGGAAGPGSTDVARGRVNQSNVQAQQQAAPARGQDQNAPATQAGQAGNAASTQRSTLVQDGQAFNRIVSKGPV